MCGIAGIVRFDAQPIDRNALDRMAASLAHRGPDGQGIHVDHSIGFVHRRLAIIDPALGVQPLVVPERKLALTYNGEIYNYVELKKELESSWSFSTHSDTEVLLAAYDRWGIACLDRVRGMFAFALADGVRGKVYLVRDRVGIKPLYVHRTAQRIAFASELEALRLAGDVPSEIDPTSVARFFRLQYVPAPRSIYRDVEKLEQACFLEIDLFRSRVAKHRYWTLSVEPAVRPIAELREELDALLDETIGIYVRSDVPFGAFLSGGVDSSLVTALMSKKLERPVRTFTIGFEEERHSEIAFAAEASRLVGTAHKEKLVSVQLTQDVLTALSHRFGEPFGDSSAVPTYYVAREAASEVKMVLSGDGGDELFGGYDSYQVVLRELIRDPLGFRSLARLAGFDLGTGRLPALPVLIRALGSVGANVLARAPESVRRVARALRTEGLWPLHASFREAFRGDELDKFLVPGLPIEEQVGLEGVALGSDVDPLSWFQAHDFKTYLADDVLTKVDRASMACSLEVRVPLLDHKVVELAFRLPLAAKLRPVDGTGIETKVLLKRSAERFFPAPFLARSKRGFGIPIVEWCRGPLRERIEDGLRDKTSGAFDWMRFDAVQATLDAFFSGQDAQVARVWYALAFDLWYRHVHRAA